MNKASLQAVNLLVKGKSDKELLAAIVAALTDNEMGLIDKLLVATNYDQRTATNVRIVAAIVEAVAPQKIEPGTMLVIHENNIATQLTDESATP